MSGADLNGPIDTLLIGPLLFYRTKLRKLPAMWYNWGTNLPRNMATTHLGRADSEFHHRDMETQSGFKINLATLRVGSRVRLCNLALTLLISLCLRVSVVDWAFGLLSSYEI